MSDRFKAILDRFSRRLNLRRDWYLIAVAAGIGMVTAYGAIGFVWLLHEAEALVEGVYERFGWWMVPVPLVVGAALTSVLVYFFAREAKGHGVPEVMDALYRKGGRIRPRVAIVKSIASVCTIGSGGSAGAEGPIVQIGSAIGSGLAQLLRLPREQASTLLGCGAAAGIASVFNAPIAGIFFVLEILLRDFSLRTFTPIVVASVMSTMLTQAHYGENEAIFAADMLQRFKYEFTIVELPSYLVLGFVCGFVALGFTRSLYFAEDFFDRLKVHQLVKPVIGALLLGVLGIAFLQLGERGVVPQETAQGVRAYGTEAIPPFFGNGYETIRGLLDPSSFTGDALLAGGLSVELWLLLLLVVCKCLATCFTLGSGGSGGVFAPSLFLGAASGAACGALLDLLGVLPAGSSPAAYALVGMAAVVAATTHAPLTSILILFELTRDVYVLLPIMLAAVVSTLVAQSFMRDSIYSLKLRRRGVLVGTMADLTIMRRLTARAVSPVPHVAVRMEDPLSKLLELRGSYHIADFVVTDDHGRYVGMVTAQDVRTALIEREAIPYLLVEELVRTDLPTVHPDDTLDRVLEKFSMHDVGSLALVDARRDDMPVGLITRSRLMRRYQEALRESSGVTQD
ncbi:MAG: chloride channel protein [Phycisphaerales bacterium]